MSIEQLVEELQEEIKKPLRLLGSAKNIFSNQIGHCLVKHCSVEEPCHSCVQCRSLYDKIDKYLKENK